MKKFIKIFFEGFDTHFNPENNFVTKNIASDYDYEITDSKPDFLFYSIFNGNFRKYNCKRIFITGENIKSDFNYCDWAFTYELRNNHPRHYRLPLYSIFEDIIKLKEPKPPFEEFLSSKRKFCNFIYSNNLPSKRYEIFKKLSKYKKIDSGGRFINNMGKLVNNKVNFLRDYKFTIAFENESYSGYTTEKIFQPMLANSLPIYWGNPEIHEDFNTKSFINCNDYKNLDDAVEQIILADKDDEIYYKYYSESYLNNNLANENYTQLGIKKQLLKILCTDLEPIASKSLTFSKNQLIANLDSIYSFMKYKNRNFIFFNKRNISLMNLRILLNKELRVTSFLKSYL
jgi:hypothetical protein